MRLTWLFTTRFLSRKASPEKEGPPPPPKKKYNNKKTLGRPCKSKKKIFSFFIPASSPVHGKGFFRITGTSMLIYFNLLSIRSAVKSENNRNPPNNLRYVPYQASDNQSNLKMYN